jgi:uncharacterized protein GlcG (DUF336 family)
VCGQPQTQWDEEMTRMTITMGEALRMQSAAAAKAQELGVAVAITIIDVNTNLVSSIRMDGVEWVWLPDDARGKAMATVVWRGEPSGNFTERAAGPMFTWLNSHYNGRLLYLKGAVPIRRDGELLGAIAASGGSGQQDEEIASAGAAALEG